MNTYSRALRHINIRDVKQKHQQKIIEQKIKRKVEREEKKYIQLVMEEKKYDWRKEINEEMLTSNVFFTSLQATGDVDLSYPGWNVLSGSNYNISDGTATISGTPPPNNTNGFAASFDATIYDTLLFDVNLSGESLLGVFFGGAESPSIVALSSGTYSLTIPKSFQIKDATILFEVPGSDEVTISNLRFQRRTPMNVFIPLDSPEAISFVRDGSDLSPEEKQKKLKEMLEASDAYVSKALGPEFPGAGATPPGEMTYDQSPPGQSGITPGVEITNFDTSKMTKNYGDTANRYMPRGGDYGPSLKPDGTTGFPKPWEMNKGNNGQWYEFVPGSGWSPIPSVGRGVKQA